VVTSVAPICDSHINRMQDAEKVCQLRSRIVQTLNIEGDFSDIGRTGGVFPFTKIYYKGERPTRSAVCTSAALHSLRPCWTAFLSILRRYYAQPKLLMHASRSEAEPQPDLCWC